MHDKNKDKKFYRPEEISFKWLLFWQYCQEPDLEPNQKSMVELFCKNNLLVVVLDRLFFIWETIKAVDRIRRVVVLYSNYYKGICLDGLSIGRLWL